MKYIKEIEITPAGRVIARVIREDGMCRGVTSYGNPFHTNRRLREICKKANEWAEERKRICDMWEQL